MEAKTEEYSVWFLAHSNWTATKNGHWANKTYDGVEHIKEYWDDTSIPRFETDDEIRVVFAKNNHGDYLFLGLYKCISIDEKTQIKTYELISNIYTN